MNGLLRRFRHGEVGAVSVEWVVLSALAVTLLAAGYSSLRDGTTDLADSTSIYMGEYR